MKKKFYYLFFLVLIFSNLSIFAERFVFATEATYAPFEFIDSDGEMQGFDIDVLNAICRTLETHCEYINQPWMSLIPSLKMQKYNGIFGALNITPERQKQIDFSIPYYYPQAAFVVPISLKNITQSTSVKNQIIGVQSGTTYQKYLEKNYLPRNQMKTYASIQDALLDLNKGRINAVLGEAPVMQYWLEHQTNSSNYHLEWVPNSKNETFGNGVAIGIQKGNKALKEELDNAIHEIIADGTLKKIETKYFNQN